MEDETRSKNVDQRKSDVKVAPTDLAYQGKHGTSETFQLDEQGGIAGVSELEDLLEIVNPYGRWNITSLAFGCMAAVENRDSISIGDGSPIYCQSRDFNVSHYSLTLVAEWDLVCENKALYSTTQSATQFGVLLGDLIFPYFMAKYGRRPVILVCSALSFVCAVGAAVSPIYSFYVLLKIAVAFFGVGYYTGCFVYTLEISSHRQRSVVGSIGGIPWSFGFLVVPGIAYLVRPWRWMQVAYSAPMLLLVSYYWIIVESPRWLISQGRYEEAEKIFLRVARINGRAFPPSKAVVTSMKKMTPPRDPRSEEAMSRRIVRNLKEYFILVIRREHRANVLISYFCWFATSMVYYGISLNSDNLSTDPYLYVALGSLAEIPSYLISWVMLVYAGRRISLAVCFWASGMAICVLAILVASMDEVPFGLLMTFAMTGKIAISAAFIICYLYTAELFPTRHRSLAVGQSSVVGRFGSMMSPYINDILGMVITWVPSALFAVTSALSAILCQQLPETRESFIEERVSSPRVEEEEEEEGDPEKGKRRMEG
ncbi:organic cation/carnitine transporter 2-like [Macrobrachium rosenbergii]|uniref:organic cation/carnitine transporter 2-like n=1 Tax=Macrobrachium rosenbergii TaxID=79674 RepID=UPI0034D507CE